MVFKNQSDIRIWKFVIITQILVSVIALFSIVHIVKVLLSPGYQK